jgi:hypothetical protein
MKTRSPRRFFLGAALALLLAGCESSDDYSSSVNIYGGVGYDSPFYDPWYGNYYGGGGGGIIVSPPIRPPHAAHLPAPMPRPMPSGRIR